MINGKVKMTDLYRFINAEVSFSLKMIKTIDLYRLINVEVSFSLKMILFHP